LVLLVTSVVGFIDFMSLCLYGGLAASAETVVTIDFDLFSDLFPMSDSAAVAMVLRP
jgi:hypothetical protein